MRDTDLRYWLPKYHGRKILPAVAYTELSVYLIGVKKKTQEEVDRLLRSMGIEVEWFRHDEARKAAEIGVLCGNFKEKARDYMIGAHAYTAPRVVITNDVTHFAFLGDRVKTPLQIMRL